MTLFYFHKQKWAACCGRCAGLGAGRVGVEKVMTWWLEGNEED